MEVNMNKCIYLKETDLKQSFEKQEHIFPAGIGGIRKLNKGVVCDKVNGEIFSKMELDFMRNSLIALPRQIQGPGKRGSLIEKKSTKSNIHVVSRNEELSDVSLGYIKLGKPYQIPQFKVIDETEIQIIFDQSDGDYSDQLVNFIDNLKDFDDKYILIVEKNIPINQLLFGNFESKWYLGVHENSFSYPLSDIINKLVNKRYSNEKPQFNATQVTCHQHMVFNIEKFNRVCAKTVFNFLAFSHGSDFVLQEKFDSIREWIINGGNDKFVNLLDKGNRNIKMIKNIDFPDESHKILINKVDNRLVGLLTLYGESFEVAVILCDNFTDKFVVNGYICDWKNKKEYTLMEYITLHL